MSKNTTPDKTVFDHGAAAAAAGLMWEKCPHPVGQERADWIAGWRMGHRVARPSVRTAELPPT